jgi:hypothetical protein
MRKKRDRWKERERERKGIILHHTLRQSKLLTCFVRLLFNIINDIDVFNFDYSVLHDPISNSIRKTVGTKENEGKIVEVEITQKSYVNTYVDQ